MTATLCRAHRVIPPRPAAPLNPYAGRVTCPACGDDDTVPFDPDDHPGCWHCCACGHWWKVTGPGGRGG